MSDIEVKVRVPACLRVEDAYGAKRLIGPGSYGLLYDDNNSESWTCALGRQIAAAIEARKPKPPKFVPGDIVEWGGSRGDIIAGVVSGGLEDGYYSINFPMYRVHEDRLTLVRRAEK